MKQAKLKVETLFTEDRKKGIFCKSVPRKQALIKIISNSAYFLHAK